MRELTEVIAQTVLSSGMRVREVLESPLPHGTELYWQLPPLCSGYADEGGAPIEGYWNFAPITDFNKYVTWYDKTLRELVKGKAAGYVPWRRAFMGCPLKNGAQSRILYSMPENWPDHGPVEACMFAVEAVDHLRACLPDTELETNDDTHLLHIKGQGPMFGVQNGAPYSLQFNAEPSLGMTIPILRSMFRGRAVADSTGSVLHRVRSWAMDNPGLVDGFEKFDTLLQGYYFGYYRRYSALGTMMGMLASKQATSENGRTKFREVLDGWAGLGPTSKGILSQAMLRLSPYPLARIEFMENVYDLKGLTPVDLPETVMAKARANLYNEYIKFCNRHGMQP